MNRANEVQRAEAWVEDHVPDLSEKTFVVTGANSGLGLETVRLLARRGARVILTVRGREKGEEAIEWVRSRTGPDARLKAVELDLASLDSVAAAARSIEALGTPIDVLINNAGVMALPRAETADGFEVQIGVNHFGHFALTLRLLHFLIKAPFGRVITVTSLYHHRGQIAFDDLDWRSRRYRKFGAYAQSKLANLLFALELERRLRVAGVPNLISLAAHPGYAATNLQQAGPEAFGHRLEGAIMRMSNQLFAQSATMGALPSVMAATSAHVEGGDLTGPEGFRGVRGLPEIVAPASHARDRETARRLWELSERRTGVRLAEAIHPFAYRESLDLDAV